MNRSAKSQALRQFLLVTGLVLAVLILALCWPSHQPTYKGRPLAHWLEPLPLTMVPSAGPIPPNSISLAPAPQRGPAPEPPGAALAAIQGMGTNAIPFLLRRLRREELPHASTLQLWLLKVGYRRPLFADFQVERAQAATALIVLGPLPADTTAELRQLSNTATNSPAGRYAAVVLAASARPALRNALLRQFQ